jgi:hypothetical protein
MTPKEMEEMLRWAKSLNHKQVREKPEPPKRYEMQKSHPDAHLGAVEK